MYAISVPGPAFSRLAALLTGGRAQPINAIRLRPPRITQSFAVAEKRETHILGSGATSTMPTDENPYAPPRAHDRAVGVKSGRREDVKTVAVAQKAIMVCILLQILAVASQFVIPLQYRPIIAMVAVCVLLASTISVFILAMKVFNIGLGIVYGIGALLPCIGLLVLFVVNQRAIKILRDNGHEVGFFGADLSKF
jgi:hypothetical protein